MEYYFANFLMMIKVDPASMATGHAIAILSEVKAAPLSFYILCRLPQ
jgi:hypothetical protein